MKDFSVNFKVPAVLVALKGKTLLVPSMILSTISVLALGTFVPQLMPIWMQLASTPGK